MRQLGHQGLHDATSRRIRFHSDGLLNERVCHLAEMELCRLGRLLALLVGGSGRDVLAHKQPAHEHENEILKLDKNKHPSPLAFYSHIQRNDVI